MEGSTSERALRPTWTHEAEAVDSWQESRQKLRRKSPVPCPPPHILYRPPPRFGGEEKAKGSRFTEKPHLSLLLDESQTREV